MGATLSHLPRTLFELLNELFVAIGAGPLGIVILAHHGFKRNKLFRTLTFTALTSACFVYIAQDNKFTRPNRYQVIFITGCDSGLGFSLAQHCHSMGYTVVAGCLNVESKGARELAGLSMKFMKTIDCDVSKSHSVNSAVRYLERFLAKDEDYVLRAVVNNAGVMVFGEFEWLTEHLIEQQIQVNVFGTMRVTKQFCPLLRKYQGRLINISSHCAFATLPGLCVYGASKAAVQALTEGLRVEQSKYGVRVISFVPGSFIGQSDIMTRHTDHVYQMNSDFTAEQKVFYGDYFQKYHAYLSAIPSPSQLRMISDCELYDLFGRALTSDCPKATYVHESLRYKIFHTLFRYSPVFLRDYFVVRFMQMPAYTPRKAVDAT